MNVAVWSYRCTKCEYAQDLDQVRYRRVLQDGSEVPISVCRAWCEDQRRIVESEELASVDVLEQLLRERDEVGSDTDAEDPLADLPGDLEREIEWRRQRTSPARCLECGSHNIVQESGDGLQEPPRLVHPGCGGLLRVSNLGMRESEEQAPIVVDEEGRRVTSAQ